MAVLSRSFAHALRVIPFEVGPAEAEEDVTLPSRFSSDCKPASFEQSF